MFTFLKDLFSGKLPEQSIRRYIQTGAHEACNMLLETGVMNLKASVYKEQIEERKQFEEFLIRSLQTDASTLVAAQTKNEQLLTLRDRVMGAVRVSELASEVNEQIHNNVGLEVINKAIKAEGIEFKSNDEAAKLLLIGIGKEFSLENIRTALRDAKENDWKDMYRDVFRTTIKQRIYILIHSSQEYMLSQPVQYAHMVSRLEDLSNTLEYVTNEILSGAQFKYNKKEANKVFRGMPGSCD
jgi:hypothetical protein